MINLRPNLCASVQLSQLGAPGAYQLQAADEPASAAASSLIRHHLCTGEGLFVIVDSSASLWDFSLLEAEPEVSWLRVKRACQALWRDNMLKSWLEESPSDFLQTFFSSESGKVKSKKLANYIRLAPWLRSAGCLGISKKFAEPLRGSEAPRWPEKESKTNTLCTAV